MLQRAVRVLGAFSEGVPRLTLSELARRADLATSTAHRLVAELLSEGLLVRGEDGAYEPGMRLWELATRANPVESLRRVASPFVLGAHAALQQVVTLCVPDLGTGTVLYVDVREEAGKAVQVGRPGGRLDLVATSSGLVILAHLPAHEAAGQLRRVAREDGAEAETELRRKLAQIRRDGHVGMVSGLVAENTAFAVPVFERGHRVIGALNVSALHAEADARRIVPVLVAAAQGISRAMGDGRDSGGRALACR